jgi:hypothetical protein
MHRPPFSATGQLYRPGDALAAGFGGVLGSGIAVGIGGGVINGIGVPNGTGVAIPGVGIVIGVGFTLGAGMAWATRMPTMIANLCMAAFSPNCRASHATEGLLDHVANQRRAMDFSAMVLTMYLPPDDGPDSDERVLAVAIEQSLLAGELGYNPWFTEHHFRGPWHSNPMQFAAFIAPQLPPDRYLGFGVLSTPYYHPVRRGESMNLRDHL